MIYTLDELLAKLGAPEVKERKSVTWRYFDEKGRNIAGAAEVRLESGGARLVAELRHTRENYEDDAGAVHESFEERFHLRAFRTAAGNYKIERMSFDGADYAAPQKSVAELGLSIFHARALDISILMVEQAFNRQDIFETHELPELQFQRAIFTPAANAPDVRTESFGVVIPFRPRVAEARG